MNKAQEMRALADKAFRDTSLYGITIEDIEIAAREGCRSLEVTGPTDYDVRRELVTRLIADGFELSDYDKYTAKMIISW